MLFKQAAEWRKTARSLILKSGPGAVCCPMILWLRKLVKALATAFALLALLLASCQSKILYQPRSYAPATIAQEDAEELAYITDQGTQRAWIHPAKAVDTGTVWLVFGGNGTVALDWPGWLPLRQGRTFVLVDYPGYGASEGRPTPGHLRDSIRALLPALATHWKTTPEALQPRLRVFGHSLGAAAALMAMNELSIQRGLLLAPFTRMKDMAQRVVGWPLCEVLHHRYDNIAELERLQKRGGSRVIICHGTVDEVIPVEQGRRLGQLFPELVSYEDLPGARHNRVLSTHRTELHALMDQLER